MSNIADPSEPAPGPPYDAAGQAQYWVARLVAQDATDAELNALENWLAREDLNRCAFARERALWQDLSHVAAAFALVPSALTDVVVALPVRVPMRARMLRALPLALAACLVVMVAGPQMLVALRADYRTGAGQIRSVRLPDGSTAMLDSGSAITVDFEKGRRDVRLLAGRAWFDVRHERRAFIVEAMGGYTQDIGTAFEVRRDADGVETSVTQGAVRVGGAAGAGPSLILQTGERSRYTAAGLQRLGQASADDIAVWRHGELQLSAMPVEAALAEIARYRAMPVFTVGDFGNGKPVSGLFLTARPDEALETVAQMRGLQVMTLPGGVVIVRPGKES